MKTNKLSRAGGVQSFLFCLGMYFVVLFFSIFVCSSIFYAIHPKAPEIVKGPAVQDIKIIIAGQVSTPLKN